MFIKYLIPTTFLTLDERVKEGTDGKNNTFRKHS